MTHTSGLPQVERSAKKADGSDVDGLYQSLGKEPLAFPPGTKEQYNNFNFEVVGHLMETVSGQAYIDFMKQRVFDPLGMKQTGVGEIQPDNLAMGYQKLKSGELKEETANVLEMGTPSGGLESNNRRPAQVGKSAEKRCAAQAANLEADDHAVREIRRDAGLVRPSNAQREHGFQRWRHGRVHKLF